MNKFKLSALAMVFSASLFTLNAQAAVLSLGPDTNLSPTAEQFQFTNSGISSASFTDYVLLDVTPYRDLTASLSSTSTGSFTFNTFGLYTGDINGVNTLVKSGSVQNIFANLSVGGLQDAGLGGSYFLKITGFSIRYRFLQWQHHPDFSRTRAGNIRHDAGRSGLDGICCTSS